jgi:hypothetical protein
MSAYVYASECRIPTIIGSDASMLAVTKKFKAIKDVVIRQAKLFDLFFIIHPHLG